MNKNSFFLAIGLMMTIPAFSQENTAWERHGSESTDTTEFIGTINTQPVKFKTCNQERMRIMPDGKIGIGIANPLETFDVLGTIRSREDIRVDGDFYVLGSSYFTNESKFFGDIRFTGIPAATSSFTGDFIVRGDGGLLKTLPLAQMVEQIYTPRLCNDDDPNWLPSWFHGPGKIYSLCAKVGILTDAPLHPLDVNGHGQFRTTLSVSQRLSIGTETTTFARFKIKNHNSAAAIQIDQSDNTHQHGKLLFMEYTNPTTEIIKVSGPNGHIPLLIDVAGNFRFKSPTNDLFLISPNDQTVYSRRIVVDQLVWPDYVFNENYRLMPLNEVKNYITEFGHLPNVPTEQEVKEKGVDLGEMDRILLEKIEELTLYIIQQQREIEKLRNEIELIKP